MIRGDYYLDGKKSVGDILREEREKKQKKLDEYEANKQKQKDIIDAYKQKTQIDLEDDRQRQREGLYYRSRPKEEDYDDDYDGSGSEPGAMSKILQAAKGKALEYGGEILSKGKALGKGFKDLLSYSANQDPSMGNIFKKQSEYAAGDTETVDGIQYVRGKDGQWHQRSRGR